MINIIEILNNIFSRNLTFLTPQKRLIQALFRQNARLRRELEDERELHFPMEIRLDFSGVKPEQRYMANRLAKYTQPGIDPLIQAPCVLIFSEIKEL